MGQPWVNGGLGMGKWGIEDRGNNDLRLNMAENENTFVIIQSLLTCVCVSEKTMCHPKGYGKLRYRQGVLGCH